VAARQARQKAREAKEELYRQLVLDAAQHVFALKGYEDAKIGEVAEQSGLSLQTLYSVFPGKADIYRAIHELGDEALHQRGLEGAHGVTDPVAALLAGLSATTLYFLEHPDFLRLRLHGGFTWGTEASAAGSRGRTEAWRAALEMLSTACQRCVDKGLFVDRDPGLMARLIVSMQQVELAHWLEGGMKGKPEQVAQEIEHQVERAFRRPGKGRPA
jgi:AcrR family transcriptional regulator